MYTHTLPHSSFYIRGGDLTPQASPILWKLHFPPPEIALLHESTSPFPLDPSHQQLCMCKIITSLKTKNSIIITAFNSSAALYS